LIPQKYPRDIASSSLQGRFLVPPTKPSKAIMNKESKHDNYVVRESTIKEPPSSIAQSLKFLGPGFILSASIVGSGELIATTTLGARAGFIAFWVIIVSCLAKVAVQLEFGKFTILTGQTAMQAFNKLQGPVLGRARWTVWVIFLLILLKIIQLGGMIGSAAIVLNMLIPGISITLWVFAIATSLAVLIYKGFYAVVEKSSLFMTLMFTMLTITSVFFLTYTPYAITSADLLSGLGFQLPREFVAVAIGAFGITGVASDEIIAYNYWCIEKGYAAYTGPRKDTNDWRRRARGWIKVMYLDATVAMVIYTLVTAAFYLLGAAVLNEQGVIPEGNELIETVALIYTESLGPGIKIIYLVGAFFVLYSSLFAALAAWTRMYSDIFGQLGWIDFFNLKQRKKVVALLAWALPFIWATTYLFVNLPVMMILSGGVVGSIMLFMTVFAALNFRYRNVLEPFRPGIFYDVALWISILSIVGVGVYGLWSLF
jgi:manganese transport protein